MQKNNFQNMDGITEDIIKYILSFILQPNKKIISQNNVESIACLMQVSKKFYKCVHELLFRSLENVFNSDLENNKVSLEEIFSTVNGDIQTLAGFYERSAVNSLKTLILENEDVIKIKTEKQLLDTIFGKISHSKSGALFLNKGFFCYPGLSDVINVTNASSYQSVFMESCIKGIIDCVVLFAKIKVEGIKQPLTEREEAAREGYLAFKARSRSVAGGLGFKPNDRRNAMIYHLVQIRENYGAIMRVTTRSFDENSQRMSVLLRAVFHGHYPLVIAAVEKGANVNQVDDHTMMTPLMIACKKGLKDIVVYLLENGANTTINLIDKQGHTARDYASSYPEIESILIEYGAESGKVPFQQAILQWTVEHKWLIASGIVVGIAAYAFFSKNNIINNISNYIKR